MTLTLQKRISLCIENFQNYNPTSTNQKINIQFNIDTKTYLRALFVLKNIKLITKKHTNIKNYVDQLNNFVLDNRIHSIDLTTILPEFLIQFDNSIICISHHPEFIISSYGEFSYHKGPLPKNINYNFLKKKSKLLTKPINNILKDDYYINLIPLSSLKDRSYTTNDFTKKYISFLIDKIISDESDFIWLKNEDLLFPDEIEIAELLE